MKLVAIWTEEYMNFKNQGFNLGSEHYFTFQWNAGSRELTIDSELTSDYFNLFHGLAIQNITGVIGMNGAGKTNFLKLINVTVSEKELRSVVVFIFHETARNKFHVVNYSKPLAKKIIKVAIGNVSIPLNDISVVESGNPFSDFSVIFYSNLVSEQNDQYIRHPRLINRSEDFLLREQMDRNSVKSYITSYDNINKDNKNRKTNFNILDIRFRKKQQSIFEFLSETEEKTEELKLITKQIPLPEFVYLNFDEFRFSNAIELAKESSFSFERFPDLIEHCLNLLRTEVNFVKRISNELVLTLFCFAFYNDLYKQTQPKTSLLELENFVRFLKHDELVFTHLHAHLKSKTNQDPYYYIARLNKVVGKISNNSYQFEGVIEQIIGTGAYAYKLKINKTLWRFIEDVNSLQEDEPEPLFAFRWEHPLSAGQIAILNQFAELKKGFEKVTKNHCLFSIDEGELYLHPEWQRQYIDLLINFINYLNTLTEEPKKIQIILSSHSPFIACDIPKFNLIFLDKETNSQSGRSISLVKSSQTHAPTFGGNIFDLFKESFYLTNFFGEFSKNWIDKAYHRLDSGETQFENKQEIDSFLKLIGEKVVRDILENQAQFRKASDQYEIINLTALAKERNQEQIKIARKRKNESKKRRK